MKSVQSLSIDSTQSIVVQLKNAQFAKRQKYSVWQVIQLIVIKSKHLKRAEIVERVLVKRVNFVVTHVQRLFEAISKQKKKKKY